MQTWVCYTFLFYNILGHKKIIGLIYIRDMCLVLIKGVFGKKTVVLLLSTKTVQWR